MISVLLTTYNSAKYILDCVNSVLKQTYKDFEFLIIDDGSIDNTKKLIDAISDSRIRYEKISHVGRSRALNYGLKACKNDWVALIDADDIAHPQRLERQYLNHLKNNNIVVISCVYFNGNKISFKVDVNNLKFYQGLVLHQKFPNSVLFNRNFILDNGGYNEELLLAEDYDLWLRLNNEAEFIIVDQVLMFCRNDINSLSRNNEDITNLMIYKIQKDYYQDLEKNFNITKPKEQNIFRGWREYFFGNPKFAKKYWLKNISSLLYPKILLAFIITFLPLKYIDKFKKMNIRLRLKYFINYYIGKNKELQKCFDETIKIIKTNS